jgi:hypothetical protein
MANGWNRKNNGIRCRGWFGFGLCNVLGGKLELVVNVSLLIYEIYRKEKRSFSIKFLVELFLKSSRGVGAGPQGIKLIPVSSAASPRPLEMANGWNRKNNGIRYRGWFGSWFVECFRAKV